MKLRAAPYTAAVSRGKGDTFEIPQDDSTGANAYRKGSPVKSQSSKDPAASGTGYGIVGSEDEGEDLVGDMDETEAYAAFLQEQAEMKARFTFTDEKRKTIGEKFIAALRRKRRMLGRNENLRFRELYKPPEPIAVALVVVVVTAVTLILTKTWPFDEL